MQHALDRQRELERDFLRISATSGRPVPVGFGIFLIRVRIYQGGFAPPYTSSYSIPQGKLGRSTADTGARLSGNISYVWSFHVISFRGCPDPCRHLPGRFCFALYIEL